MAKVRKSTAPQQLSLDPAKQKEFKKDTKKLKKSLLKTNAKPTEEVAFNYDNKLGLRFHNRNSGAVVLSHIPHGFYEKEMKEYFSQFGVIEHARLVRSERNGRSKGYAFIKFTNKEVAKIVANTMNNYLMFSKILKCKYIPASQISKGMFSKKAMNGKCIGVTNLINSTNRINKIRDDYSQERRLVKLSAAYRKKINELQRLGVTVDLNIPKIKQTIKKPSKRAKKLCIAKKRLAKKIKDRLAVAKIEDIDDTAKTETGDGDGAAAEIEQNVTAELDISVGMDKIIMEVDENDDEIQIKTPPNVIKKHVKVLPSAPLKFSKLTPTKSKFFIGTETPNQKSIDSPISLSAIVKISSENKNKNSKKKIKSQNNSISNTPKSVTNLNIMQITPEILKEAPEKRKLKKSDTKLNKKQGTPKCTPKRKELAEAHLKTLSKKMKVIETPESIGAKESSKNLSTPTFSKKAIDADSAKILGTQENKDQPPKTYFETLPEVPVQYNPLSEAIREAKKDLTHIDYLTRVRLKQERMQNNAIVIALKASYNSNPNRPEFKDISSILTKSYKKQKKGNKLGSFAKSLTPGTQNKTPKTQNCGKKLKVPKSV